MAAPALVRPEGEPVIWDARTNPTAAGNRLCVSGVRPDSRGAVDGRRENLEGVYGGHENTLPPPSAGAKDGNMNAKAGDQYATRHNPFVYFASITSSPDCQNNVVDFTAMAGDLKVTSTSPNLAYTPICICAMTGMTHHASTDDPVGWSAQTSGSGSRFLPSWTPRRLSRTECWSSPSMSPRPRLPGLAAYREVPPAAGSAPW